MQEDVLKKPHWETVAEGVWLCRFFGQEDELFGEGIPQENLLIPHRLELFFCSEGSFVLRCENRDALEIKREDVLLSSELADAFSMIRKEPVKGIFLVIDPQVCSAFQQIYTALNRADFCIQPVFKILGEHRGALRIKYGGWNQIIFSILRTLPEQEQGSYCLLKAAELIYILNAYKIGCEQDPQQMPMPGYLVRLLNAVESYIEDHLGERLTISLLCRQFNVSATTLKTKFRELYGQSIHSWVLNCRIHKAAELLQYTDMTVLQIAQSVGYESASQFNVTFRRVYGITPSHYRKNVQNRSKMTDSVGNKTVSDL